MGKGVGGEPWVRGNRGGYFRGETRPERGLGGAYGPGES
jgi:hypothetical protein